MSDELKVLDEYTSAAAPIAECGSIIEQDKSPKSRGLFNAVQPQYVLKREKLQHRAVIMLKARALSNREVAEALGMTAVAVGYIVNQPWAQEQVLAEIEQAGRDEVQTLLQGAASDSVIRLINERDNDKAKPSERIAAANSLLDRLFGKPNQPISMGAVNMNEMSDQQLAAIANTQPTSRTASS